MSHHHLSPLPLLILLLSFTFPARAQQSQPVTNFERIKAMVDSNRIEMTYTVATTHYSYFLEPATPYSNQNIRIGQDSAFIIVRDSIAAGYLPYFSGGYTFPRTGTNGIVFSNKMIHPVSQVKGQGNRQSITYEFSVVGLNDSYKISIIIRQGGICYLYVNSTKRSPMSYIGQVVEKVY